MLTAMMDKHDQKTQALMMGEWQTELAGMSKYQVMTALSELKYRDGRFPPSVKEFRDLGLGLPNIDGMIFKSKAGLLSDPLTVEFVRRVGSYDLKKMNDKQIASTANAIYSDCYKSIFPDVLGLDGPWTQPKKIEARKVKAEPIDPNKVRQMVKEFVA